MTEERGTGLRKEASASVAGEPLARAFTDDGAPTI